jgi:hypothetical protein
MPGEEKAAGCPPLQSSHIDASAAVPYWVHFTNFFTASCPLFPRVFPDSLTLSPEEVDWFAEGIGARMQGRQRMVQGRRFT